MGSHHPLRLALLLGLAVAACSGQDVGQTFSSARVTVGEENLTVWVADESAERQQGLADLDELPSGVDGMLFVWPTPVSASFTMEDTLIALDIWWIDADGVVVGSAAMEPCPQNSCVSYRSPGPVRWALETPSGTVDLEVGARFSTTENS